MTPTSRPPPRCFQIPSPLIFHSRWFRLRIALAARGGGPPRHIQDDLVGEDESAGGRQCDHPAVVRHLVELLEYPGPHVLRGEVGQPAAGVQRPEERSAIGAQRVEPGHFSKVREPDGPHKRPGVRRTRLGGLPREGYLDESAASFSSDLGWRVDNSRRETPPRAEFYYAAPEDEVSDARRDCHWRALRGGAHRHAAGAQRLQSAARRSQHVSERHPARSFHPPSWSAASGQLGPPGPHRGYELSGRDLNRHGPWRLSSCRDWPGPRWRR